MHLNSAGGATSFASTVDYLNDPRFKARMHVIHVPPIPQPGHYNIRDEARLFLRVIRAAFKEHVLLLYSSRGYFKPELLAAVVLGFWPRRFRPTVLFYGDMYEPSRAPLRHLVERLIMKMADRGIYRYILYSAADCSAFRQRWKVDAEKIRSSTLYAHYTNLKLPDEAVEPGDYVFAGGESFRNFEPLLEAAARMPHQKFIFATSLLKNKTDLPANITVTSPRFNEYISLLRRARVVIVPLQQNTLRSAGATTYLNAMCLKKPVIVTDALGVREYVEDRKTGLIVNGSPEHYIEALNWLLDPANTKDVELLCAEAYFRIYRDFTVANHVTGLLNIIDEAIAERSAIG